MITLVITIVVIIILAAMGFVMNDNALDEAISVKFKQEITEVKKGVDTIKLINSKQGLDEATINKNFKKVLVENPPQTFVSFDENELTAYLIDLKEIDYDDVKTGNEYKKINSGDTVTFDEHDVYIYDKNGTVYYVKGMYIEGTGTIYTANEGKIEGPLVSAENTIGGTVRVNVTPMNNGEIVSVTVGGRPATKIGEGVYQIEVDANGSYIVTATEAGCGTSKTTVNVTKIDEEVGGENTVLAPTIAEIKINAGESFTKNEKATLHINTDAELIIIKHFTTGTSPITPSETDSGWRNKTETSPLVLSEGMNNVYVWFMNRGNSTILEARASIILDTIAPTATMPTVEIYDEHSFRITCNQIDPEIGSGLRKIEVGYKLVEDSDFKWVEIPDLISKTIEIENNRPDRQYQIKTRAEDNVGHSKESYEFMTSLNGIPSGVKIEYNPTVGWTKRSTVTITYPESANDIYEKWYRLDEGEWKIASNYTEVLYIEENMKIDAVVVKKTVSETLFGEMASVEITNIDNKAPIIKEIDLDPINIINTEDYRGIATLEDNESGIVGYAITNSAEVPSTWVNLKDIQNNININFDVMAETEYYIWVKDAAENVSNERIFAEKIDAKTSRIIAKLSQTEYTYSGLEHEPTVTVEDTERGMLVLGTHYDIEYIDNINAGTAKVKITTKRAYEGVIELEFTILKAEITPTLNMTGYTYAGTKATPTVNGNIENGNVTYYYNTSNTNSGGNDWSSVTSAITLNAGTYYMYAVVDETLNYNGAKTQVVPFTIEKGIVTPTISMSGYTYAGTKSTPSINGNMGNGTVTYYYRTTSGTTGGTAWSSVTSATSLNAGTYYMYATIPETTNYKSATAPAVSFTIAKANGRVSLSPSSRTITSTSTTSTTSTISSHGGTLSCSSSTSSVTASISGTRLTVSRLGNVSNNSTVTVTVTSAATTNYKAASATFKITKSLPEYDCICTGCDNIVYSSNTHCSTCSSETICDSCPNCEEHFEICSSCGECEECGCDCTSSGGGTGTGSHVSRVRTTRSCPKMGCKEDVRVLTCYCNNCSTLEIYYESEDCTHYTDNLDSCSESFYNTHINCRYTAN